MSDPGHLLELAAQLANSPGAGAPKQAVLRRSASTAYYAVFHALSWNIAVTFVPANVWKARALFYRSLEHGKTKDRCKKLGQNPLPAKEKAFFATQSFGVELRSFANSFVQLQEIRHRSDYDLEYKLTKAQAQQAVDDATQAIASLNNANADERSKFLAYLLFDIRT
jgi:uncharacterized protein (UPF0332 family)